MNTTVVIYTNQQGYKEFREVPENFIPSKYHEGILLGPPSLDSLDLPKKQKIKLNNALVDAGLCHHRHLDGKRYLLVSILRDVLGIEEEDKIRFYRNSIIALYQQEAFPSASEE